MGPPGSAGCKPIMERGIYSSKRIHTEEDRVVLMASPAVNLPLWTQEGGRTGQVDQFPPGTEVPGLGYLGNGVGGGGGR